MIRRLALLCAAGILLAGLPAWGLDPAYHTNEEIYQEITALQQLYPTMVRVDTIGYSHRDHLPIWAVKLSHNVAVDEDQPTVLFVGQVHAEEILGVEVVMALLDTIIDLRQATPFNIYLQQLEMWFVPTANPEGHAVVMDSLDFSYRKNKHDINGNGVFDYFPGMGGDIDGVDINRNFPLNWAKGDTFMQPGGTESYDYYRGPAPLSETETQALWEFGARERFAFSLVWHSSRSGHNAEKIFYPWDWDDSGKLPPDHAALDEAVENLSGLIPRLVSGYYNPFPTDAPRGNQHDATYAEYGAFAYLIECGDANLQPPYPIMRQVILANLQGAYYILARATGYETAPIRARLTGTVKDPAGLALSAVVTISELDGPYLKPRTCDPDYGRYRRYLMPGTYTLNVSLRGYYPQTQTVNAGNTWQTTRNFTLQPKPSHLLQGVVQSLIGGDPLAGTLYIHGEDVADTVVYDASGTFSHTLPEGDYALTFDSPGYVVRFSQITLNDDLNLIFELSPATTLLAETFEAGLASWISGGSNNYWGVEISDSLWNGSQVATESPYFDDSLNTDCWLEYGQPLDLSSSLTAALRFHHWQYLEPGYDHAFVQVSSNGGSSWETVAGPFDGQDLGWGAAYADLTPYCGLGDVRLRFCVWTDNTLRWPGWRLDDVTVTAADTVSAVPPQDLPQDYALVSLYPNPFNSRLSVKVTLPQAGPADLAVWDVQGRLVSRLHAGTLSAGAHRFTLEMPAGQASGMYFLRLERAAKTTMHKIVYLK
ncbi:MAG: T9SS C-terminal target domain-containing protein [Candidatus Zixiibacteriota bacterium]|nr:MAG: T9SS C-terminal target domain-containing protein [candidate division Zixibacteria bacterium]